MSYILEALKKAQAERQLGSAPTIHATPIQAAPVASAAGSRTPLWIAVAVAATLAGVAALLWWRGPAPVAPAVLAVQPIVAEPPVVVAPAPIAPPVIVAQAPPVQAAPPVAYQAPVAAPARPAVAAHPVRAPAAPVAPALPPAQPAPVAEPAAAEENLPFMSQLPEPQRSEVPKVSFGGYMYSKNPADRMLIVDKVLRREGEEVAPGLVLEQLQSKAAVLNYRGTRYRLAY